MTSWKILWLTALQQSQLGKKPKRNVFEKKGSNSIGLIIFIVHVSLCAKKKSPQEAHRFSVVPDFLRWSLLLGNSTLPTRWKVSLQAVFPNCSVLFPINSHVHVEGKRKLFRSHIGLRCCVPNTSKQKQPSSSYTSQMNALFKRVVLAKETASWLLTPSNFAQKIIITFTSKPLYGFCWSLVNISNHVCFFSSKILNYS